ncbi:MAG: hypothetical protein H6706_02270 [Myxococcales bacterium]|nr:hypothetical protein [Myxococcales bacterium]
MAFDLRLSVDLAACRSALEALAASTGCTVVVSPAGASFGLPHDNDAARVAFAGLVALVRAHGGQLHDPQAGATIDLANPGSWPPAWVDPADGLPPPPRVVAQVQVRLRTDNLAYAKHFWCERLGGRVLFAGDARLEVDLYGVRVVLHLGPKARPKPALVGPGGQDQLPATCLTLTLPAGDYDALLRRLRAMAQYFSFQPRPRQIDGGAQAESFVVADSNVNFVEVRRG